MKIIRGKKWYKPREIAQLGLITNFAGSSRENSNYNFILKQIKVGALIAKNYSVGNTPYWLVSEDAIEQFNKQFD